MPKTPVELPEFKPGEPLYAVKLTALADAILELREEIAALKAVKAPARKAPAKAE